MSTAGKALILTWVMIGLLVAGVVGFYLGRNMVPKNQGIPQGGVQQPGQQGGQPQGSPPPTGGQQPPQGQQQNPPAGGGQPPLQR